MRVYHKPMFFVLEAAFPDVVGDNLTDWALQMEADRKKVKNTDIQVAAAWGSQRGKTRVYPAEAGSRYRPQSRAQKRAIVWHP